MSTALCEASETVSAPKQPALTDHPPRVIVRTCSHMLDSGRLCQSPALRGQSFCHHHADVQKRRSRMARARRYLSRVRLPVLLDVAAVQEGKARVRSAVAGGFFSQEDANLMEQVLNMLGSNLRYMEAKAKKEFRREEVVGAGEKRAAKSKQLN